MLSCHGSWWHTCHRNAVFWLLGAESEMCATDQHTDARLASATGAEHSACRCLLLRCCCVVPIFRLSCLLQLLAAMERKENTTPFGILHQAALVLAAMSGAYSAV